MLIVENNLQDLQVKRDINSKFLSFYIVLLRFIYCEYLSYWKIHKGVGLNKHLLLLIPFSNMYLLILVWDVSNIKGVCIDFKCFYLFCNVLHVGNKSNKNIKLLSNKAMS